jgi:hypothetical protein
MTKRQPPPKFGSSFFDFTTSSRSGHVLWAGFRLGEAHAVRRTFTAVKLLEKFKWKGPK